MKNIFHNNGSGGGRFRAFALAATIVCSPSGCHDARTTGAITTACQTFGLCERARPAGMVIDVAFDTSLGSPCTGDVAHTTVGQVLQALADRPGAVGRFWSQGTELSDTTLLSTVENVGTTRTGSHAVRSHRDRFLRDASGQVDQAVAPIFQAPHRRRSPIVETLSRIAMTASPHGLPRTILLVTDAREVSSFGDFECDVVPTPRRFLPLLRRRGALAPGSLRGVNVVFAYVNLGPVVGRVCPVTIARANAIENLWRAALTEAGAESVRFERGLVPMEALTTTPSGVRVAEVAR